MKININKKTPDVRPAPNLIQGNIYQHNNGDIYIYSKSHNILVNLSTGDIFYWAGGYGPNGSEFVNVTNKYEIVEQKMFIKETMSKTPLREPISPFSGASINLELSSSNFKM